LVLKSHLNLILLGGTEIDVAKLYKSSQDALKEQKETINSLNQKIEIKNCELNFKINSIEEQKSIINNQTKNIKNYEEKLNAQAKLLEEQKKQLNEIQTSIEAEKNKLSNAITSAKEKESVVDALINLQNDKQLEFEKTKKDLEILNSQIEEQKNNLIIKEHTISDQKNIILALGLLSMVIIALGLNGLRLNRLLKNLSQTDALSGLYNRRFMNKGLQDEIMKFKRYKTPFALLLLDIDYFKKINDTFGHDKGDLVIKKISSLMQKHIRSTDICARWGGEEFLILASNIGISRSKIYLNKQNLYEDLKTPVITIFLLNGVDILKTCNLFSDKHMQ
jgi:GGDEF domain-containing protein